MVIEKSLFQKIAKSYAGKKEYQFGHIVLKQLTFQHSACLLQLMISENYQFLVAFSILLTLALLKIYKF